MAPHLWVSAAHNRGPRCVVLLGLKPLGGDTHAGRSALKRRRLQGPPATKQEELAHEPGSPARVACPSVEHAAATRRSIDKKIEGRAAEVVREYLGFHGYANTLKCIPSVVCNSTQR